MKIRKEAQAESVGMPNADQMEAINVLAKGQMQPEQVYVFSVRLCDDQEDRDGERFDTAALPELARLFVGKTGITDHKWSSDRQVARIFATEVVQEGTVSYLKAWAYLRRGGNSDEVIADIEAGIKKEVSIGCAMGRSVCSICGSDYGTCGHQKGKIYDGRKCCAILREALDAYEFSFVAVPAQRDAGVLKGFYGETRPELKELAQEFGVQAEYRELFRQAQLGKQYEKQLKNEVVRLCLCLELGMEEPALQALVEKAGAEELRQLKEALECYTARRIPMHSQLLMPEREIEPVDSGYLI